MTLEEIEKYQYDQYIKECNRAKGCCGILVFVGTIIAMILISLMLTPFIV